MAAVDVEAVDFEPDEDDLMDEDANVSPQPVPKLRSTISGGRPGYSAGDSNVARKTKGRGFREESEIDKNNRIAAKDFDSLDSDGTQGPQRCERPCCSLSVDFLGFLLFCCSVAFFCFISVKVIVHVCGF